MPPEPQLPPLVAIVGPTASGKTGLGITLAKQFNGEVVSADSRAVYRGMDIGTAKPTPAEQQGVAHHLLDAAAPTEAYSVARYKRDALAVIADIQKRDKLALLVGGTGLYVKAIVDNLSWPKVPANPALRRKLEQKTPEGLFKTLSELDPDTAAVIDAHNPRRLVRALEVRLVSGKSFFAQQQVGSPLFRLLMLGLAPDKETLAARIDKRVDEQIESGLEVEVRALVKKYTWQSVLASTINYQEWRPYFEGRATLAQTISALKTADRQYAKRQLTWFKKEPRIRWLKNPTESPRIVEQFLRAF